MKLPSLVKFTDSVQPIRFTSIPTVAGLDVFAMGFGLVNDKVFPHNLQYASFKTIPLNECAPVKPNLIPKDSLICAKDVQSRLCLGDAGNPLVNSYTGKLMGIAVSTWGDCEIGPQSFTGINAYIDWINRIMNDIAIKQNAPEVFVLGLGKQI